VDLATLRMNEAEDWITFGAVAGGVFVALYALRWIAVHFTERGPERARLVAFRSLIAELERRTNVVLLALVALFIGSRSLILTSDLDNAARALTVITLLLQAGIWGAASIRFAVRTYEQGAGADSALAGSLGVTRYFGTFAMWVLVLLLVLDNVGVQVTALVAGLGIGGIAIALAAQSVLGDLFASFVIVVDKPFKEGDFIIVGDLMGSVEHVGIKTTRIRSLWGEQLVFSNSDLTSSRIRNFGLMQQRRILFSVGVTYDTPPDTVERIPEMIREAVESQDLTRFDRAHFSGYGDSSLDMEIVYYVLSGEYTVYMDIQQGINLALLRRFGDEGIDFAFPTRTLHVYGEELTPAPTLSAARPSPAASAPRPSAPPPPPARRGGTGDSGDGGGGGE
jgi:small-conductance mechanosensitive channel